MGHEKSIYDTAASTKMFGTLTAAFKAGGKEMLQEDKGPINSRSLRLTTPPSLSSPKARSMIS